MIHITRDLCGGQICVTPDFASFTNPETEPWLQKFYTINEDWQAEDRRKLLAYARDLLNSRPMVLPPPSPLTEAIARSGPPPFDPARTAAPVRDHPPAHPAVQHPRHLS
jgi:hypothetical protein